MPFNVPVDSDSYRGRALPPIKKSKAKPQTAVFTFDFLIFYFLRGPERIRTAVRAFAELCLATRPQDQLSSKPALLALFFGQAQK